LANALPNIPSIVFVSERMLWASSCDIFPINECSGFFEARYQAARSVGIVDGRRRGIGAK